ncbi:phage tail tube protein [Sphingomonas montana]|uniref:phage tail tube protein n=1 Tax=Sphingomonas montana TaxID=1843236 RepID=UPI00096F8519|nr:phage tail tube protein [Sphingomonas montana]
MAKKLGNNLRLFVKAAGAETFAQPQGQGNLTINRSSSPIDLGTKDTGQYGASAPGPKTLSLAQSFIPDLPDTAYARMKSLDASGDTTIYQVREKPFAEDNVVFECEMYTVFGNTDGNQNAAVGTSATLNAATAPTVDEI